MGQLIWAVSSISTLPWLLYYMNDVCYRSSADNLCKQPGPRPKHPSSSGSNLVDTQMVFMKEFFEKVDFEKNQQTTKKNEIFSRWQRDERVNRQLLPVWIRFLWNMTSILGNISLMGCDHFQYQCLIYTQKNNWRILKFFWLYNIWEYNFQTNYFCHW